MTPFRRMRRRLLAATLATLLAPSAMGQPPSRPVRIGFISGSSAGSYGANLEALRKGLADLGHVEGKSFELDIAWADGDYDRLTQLAAEMIRRKVEVVVTHSTTGALAVRRASETIPIVCVAMSDPVGSGLASSLARPGRNLTGVSVIAGDMYRKRLQLLREALPRAARAAVLFNPRNPVYNEIFTLMLGIAPSLGLEIRRYEATNAAEIMTAAAAMARDGVDALLIAEDPSYYVLISTITRAALDRRIPTVSGADFVPAGAMVGYGVNRRALFHGAASQVDKILRGARAGDLPIEQPTTFDLIVNVATARSLGVSIPQSILVRADQTVN